MLKQRILLSLSLVCNFLFTFMPHYIFLIFYSHSTSREDFGNISFAQIGRRMSPEQFVEVAGAFLAVQKLH